MRIASLSPAITEILCALGVRESIVCRDKFSDVPEDVASIPRLPDHQSITREMLLPFKPELIFTETLVQETLKEELADPLWNVVHFDPRSLAEIHESILLLGTLLDVRDRATSLSLSFRQAMNDVKKKATMLPRCPRVYVEEWHHPPMVSGNWVPEVIKTAGGEPFPLPPRAASRKVALEEVRAFDPDLIVLSICGAGTAAKPELLTGRDGWCDLRAVIEGNVRVIDDSLLNRPGPRLADGARRLYGWMFEALH